MIVPHFFLLFYGKGISKKNQKRIDRYLNRLQILFIGGYIIVLGTF